MGHLQELITQSTIEFPELISTDKVEDYFKYLADNSIQTNYTMNVQGRVARYKSESPPIDDFVNEKYCSDIFGTMANISKEASALSSSHFNCIMKPFEKDDEYLINIAGLKFQTIPGYGLRSHRVAEVHLWDKIRKLTDQYFQKHQEKL